MSLLLTVRMAVLIREFDASLDDRMPQDDQELILPMPFLMS
jgi:hypothetical protein